MGILKCMFGFHRYIPHTSFNSFPGMGNTKISHYIACTRCHKIKLGSLYHE